MQRERPHCYYLPLRTGWRRGSTSTVIPDFRKKQEKKEASRCRDGGAVGQFQLGGTPSEGKKARCVGELRRFPVKKEFYGCWSVEGGVKGWTGSIDYQSKLHEDLFCLIERKCLKKTIIAISTRRHLLTLGRKIFQKKKNHKAESGIWRRDAKDLNIPAYYSEGAGGELCSNPSTGDFTCERNARPRSQRWVMDVRGCDIRRRSTGPENGVELVKLGRKGKEGRQSSI